jgi:cytokinesis protein
MSSADKSRQSSGGRSLFSRSKNKDRRQTEADSRYLDQHDAASIMSSRSSNHRRDSSTVSIDRPNSADPAANLMAGIMTSIPYDTVTSGSRSPVPVEYLPKGDQMPVRREPLPHQLNKGDYHQYPSFDPATTFARPGPTSGVTMASTGRNAQYQQWGPARGSMASTTNGSHASRYDSYYSAAYGSRQSTADSHASGMSPSREETRCYGRLTTQ